MKNALLHVDADEPSLQLYKLCVLHGWTYHKVDTATELYNIDLDARIILCESRIPDFENSKVYTAFEEIHSDALSKNPETTIILYTKNMKELSKAHEMKEFYINKEHDPFLVPLLMSIFTGPYSNRIN